MVEQLNEVRRFFIIILQLNVVVKLWKCSLKMLREGGRGGAIFVLSVILRNFVSLLILKLIFLYDYIMFFDVLCTHNC